MHPRYFVSKPIAAAVCLAFIAAACAVGTTSASPNGLSFKLVYPDGKPAADGAMVLVFINRNTNSVTTRSYKADRKGDVAIPDNDSEPANCDGISYFKSPAGVGFYLAYNPQSSRVITLQPFTKLRVHLVDSSGSPFAGVRIAPNLFTEDSQAGRMEQSWNKNIPGLWSQTTDASGAATIVNLPQGLGMNLGVVGNTLTLINGNVQLSSGPVTPDATLHVGIASSVSGRVLFGTTGKPVAGIQVSSSGTEVDGSRHWATTDEDGRYTIAGLAMGPYGIQAVKDDAKFKGWLPLPRGVQVDAATHVTDIDLSIVQAGIVTGSITDKSTGKPVKDVDVTAWAPEVPTGYADNTGNSGSYTMEVAPGKATIEVMAGGPGDVTSKKVTIAAGKTVKVDFQIQSP